jgi:hypothetical protein
MGINLVQPELVAHQLLLPRVLDRFSAYVRIRPVKAFFLETKALTSINDQMARVIRESPVVMKVIV